jgi:hypothetical protein
MGKTRSGVCTLSGADYKFIVPGGPGVRVVTHISQDAMVSPYMTR